jgi:hypothetical protein
VIVPVLVIEALSPCVLMPMPNCVPVMMPLLVIVLLLPCAKIPCAESPPVIEAPAALRIVLPSLTARMPPERPALSPVTIVPRLVTVLAPATKTPLPSLPNVKIPEFVITF